MKYRAVAYVVATVTLGGMCSAQAAALRSVDARSLDIAGVKTGMTYDQALHAAADHFHVGIDQIKPDPFPAENLVTHTHLPLYFKYQKDGAELTVYFEPRVPVDNDNPLVVSLIKYEIPWTSNNKAQMHDAALAKYGQPSNGVNGLSMEWCASPNSNPGLACSFSSAVLKVSEVSMSLNDSAYTNARIKFVNDSKAVKPNF